MTFEALVANVFVAKFLVSEVRPPTPSPTNKMLSQEKIQSLTSPFEVKSCKRSVINTTLTHIPSSEAAGHHN